LLRRASEYSLANDTPVAQRDDAALSAPGTSQGSLLLIELKARSPAEVQGIGRPNVRSGEKR